MDTAVSRQSSGSSFYHSGTLERGAGAPLFPREDRPVMLLLRPEVRGLPAR